MILTIFKDNYVELKRIKTIFLTNKDLSVKQEYLT